MKNDVLVLMEKCSHCLSFYDLESGNKISSIGLEDYPHEFVVDHEEKYAYAAYYGVLNSGVEGTHGNKVFIIDLAKQEIAKILSFKNYRRLHGITIDGNGRLYVLSENNHYLMIKNDPFKGDTFDRFVATGGERGHLMAVNQKGTKAFTMNIGSHNVSYLDLSQKNVPPIVIDTGYQKPEGFTFNSDESKLYVTNRLSDMISIIDTKTLQVIGSFPARKDPLRMKYFNEQLIVINYGDQSLSIINPENNQELKHVAFDSNPLYLSIDDTRKMAFVSLFSNELAVFNMKDWSFIKKFKTGIEPDVSYLIKG